MLHELHNEFDVIMLSKTWSTQDCSFFDLDGYVLMHYHETYIQNDGAVVYLKNTFDHNYEIVDDVSIKILYISFVIHNRHISLIAVYRPSATNVK